MRTANLVIEFVVIGFFTLLLFVFAYLVWVDEVHLINSRWGAVSGEIYLISTPIILYTVGAIFHKALMVTDKNGLKIAWRESCAIFRNRWPKIFYFKGRPNEVDSNSVNSLTPDERKYIVLQYGADSIVSRLLYIESNSRIFKALLFILFSAIVVMVCYLCWSDYVDLSSSRLIRGLLMFLGAILVSTYFSFLYNRRHRDELIEIFHKIYERKNLISDH